MTPAGGMERIVEVLTEKLEDPLLTSHPVTRLERSGTGYLVHHAGETLEADHVVITTPAWHAASLVEPAVDINSLLIVDYTQLLPITGAIAPPGNVSTMRNGDTVTISWDAINIDPSGARGYLVDVFVCQAGAYIKFIANPQGTSIDITDQQNTCAGPSGGKLYGAAATGYTEPVTVPWP